MVCNRTEKGVWSPSSNIEIGHTSKTVVPGNVKFVQVSYWQRPRFAVVELSVFKSAHTFLGLVLNVRNFAATWMW